MTRAERLVDTLGRWTDRLTRRPRLAAGVVGAWTLSKTAVAAVVSPVGAGVVAWRATANHRHAKSEMAHFARQIIDGGPPDSVDLDASSPTVITSDLHRCIAGARDLVGAQDDRELYLAMLDWYADGQYLLVENGDVEDFWMVGGSPWGAAYDLLRTTGAALSVAGGALRRATYLAHLDRIIDANAEIYETITRRFVDSGRYVRTIGNHDDVYADPVLRHHLVERLGGAVVTEWVRLVGPAGVEAVITHGHQVDGWNAPGRDALGKLASWLADTLGDLPTAASLAHLDRPELTAEIISGQRANRLLAVHERFGANASYDSLDEELLYEALRSDGREHPWLLLGHTHSPVFEPRSRSGGWWARYANPGYGIGAGLITALEWPGGPAPHRPQLVAWCWGDRPEWSEHLEEMAPTCTRGDRPVHRVPLGPSGDHRSLVPVGAALRRSG